MLLYVPQGYVALVYEDGELRAVVEAGVGFVAPAGARWRVQYLDLQQQQPEPQREAEGATLH